jgi:hypothetical protein
MNEFLERATYVLGASERLIVLGTKLSFPFPFFFELLNSAFVLDKVEHIVCFQLPELWNYFLQFKKQEKN